ncbi:LppA family lipoprotein [Sanguibacter sp. Leaf3]|uniref:LppA family lipoprotein n=1 Tax=Sanguibacter sp. Leaf3 TaxID=1736209 RepID=UPI0012E3A3B1|nr:LppA family lipoprotein [Sanguibacter sp. Leaf3]
MFALVGGLLTGCVDDSDTMSTEQETDAAITLAAIDELMALPSAEDARSGSEGLSIELRDALDERFGSTGWVVESRFSRGTVCGGTYDVLDGRSVYVTAFAEDQALDHEDWAEAVDVISAVAADHGFDDPLMLAEGPGLHQLEIFGDRGSVIRFGSEVSLGVTVESGCYLTDDTRAAIEEFGVPDPGRWARLYPDSTAIPTEP